MTESTVGFRVAVDDTVVGITFCAVVVGELDNSVAVRPVAFALQRPRSVVAQEIEGEFVFREVKFLDLTQAEEFVEFH